MFDLVLIVNGRKEKIASGLLKPFLGHLKAAQDQIAKGGYSITLEPSSGFDAPWFTRGLTCLSDDGKVILPHPIGGCTTETATSHHRRQTQAQATTSGLDQRFGGDHAGETTTEPAAGGLGSARRQRARRVDDDGHSDAVGRGALAVARDGRRAWLRRVRDGAASGDCGMGGGAGEGRLGALAVAMPGSVRPTTWMLRRPGRRGAHRRLGSAGGGRRRRNGEPVEGVWLPAPWLLGRGGGDGRAAGTMNRPGGRGRVGRKSRRRAVSFRAERRGGERRET
ncbi:hypothetical protein ACP70R_037308 [Stipagrostis hirtigluma subsp. patula]